MQVLINVSVEEIKNLQNMKEIRGECDIVYCLHELIARATTKEPEDVEERYSTQYGEIRVGKCPSCGEDVGDMYNVCLKCRRRILWEGENGQ